MNSQTSKKAGAYWTACNIMIVKDLPKSASTITTNPNKFEIDCGMVDIIIGIELNGPREKIFNGILAISSITNMCTTL